MYCGNIALRKNPLYNETELFQLGEFLQKHHLSLYHGVPVSDLAPMDGSAAPPPQDGWFTFLVCQGDAALLAAYLPRGEWDRGGTPDGFPGLLTLELSDSSRVYIRSALEQALKDLLGKGSGRRWRFLGRPVPPERLPELAGAQLVEKRYAAGCEEYQWFPTEYGADRGLVGGYVFQGGQEPQVKIWCSERTGVDLEKLLAWEPAGAGTKAEGALPLSERIARLDREPEGGGAEAVRRFANMPLDSYMRDFPEALARLREALPMLEDAATYQDAAALVYWLFQDGEPWPEELREISADVYPGLGARLMNDLALPLFARLQARGC